MAKITLQKNTINTYGDLPKVGDIAPDFKLTNTDLSQTSLKDYENKNLILNIFPSLDTQVCAQSVRRFNKELNDLDDTVVLCVSKDLPFAHSRFCVTEGLENVKNGSSYKDNEFGKTYGTLILDGPLQNLEARAVVVIGKDKKVKYSELVSEITNEPDYLKALQSL